MTRVAVNGFGRIGRSVLRACLAGDHDVQVVAVNDTNEIAMLAYLLEFDSVHGALETPVVAGDGELVVGDLHVPVFHDREPARLPWSDVGVDVVIESTGRFTMADAAAAHLDAGAGRVVISAPATGADITVCMGVNDDAYDPERHRVVSNASCTTNCLAVMALVLEQRFGIESGFMTTVHAYTNDQNLLDLPHRGFTRDLRRSRAAGLNIVPSTTGAARAIAEVIPRLRGRLDGVAIRVPVADGSLVDLVCRLEQPTDRDEVNDAFTAALGGTLGRVLEVTARPLVSSDVVGNPHSCVFSAHDTIVRGREVKVFGWYDNEWAYANRLVELAELMGASAGDGARRPGVAAPLAR